MSVPPENTNRRKKYVKKYMRADWSERFRDV